MGTKKCTLRIYPRIVNQQRSFDLRLHFRTTKTVAQPSTREIEPGSGTALIELKLLMNAA
jgi:hypothetical protein